jgi:hypothetical protein
VIDDQINGNQRLDVFWVFAHFLCNTTHGSEVGEQGNAGKILQHDAGDHVVFIAEVTRCTSGGPRAPLLYHASRFHTGLSASP